MAEPADKQDIYNILKATDDDTDRLQVDITNNKDVVMDRLFTMGRDTADLRAQVTAVGYQLRDGFAAAAKDAEIYSLRSQVEAQKNVQLLADKISEDGEKTRARINDINDRDNNRALIERNTELVAALDDGRFWRGRYDDSQWQGLNSRLQAFQSDLQDTRQGMVNFGTMAGVGQSSAQNTVR